MSNVEKTAERRKELQCRIHHTGELQTYKYVVVCSYYEGRWLLSRHKKRDTWETQGGHIEPGETPMDAARRELYEETGALEADIVPVCLYRVDGGAYGLLCRAEVRKCGPIPAAFEMAEVRFFDAPPGNWTYPHIVPWLLERTRF